MQNRCMFSTKLFSLCLFILMILSAPAHAASCIDMDGDNYGANGHPSCPAGKEVDCDDNDATVNPGAPFETCDGKDTDCDGWKPPNDIDADGDGFPVCGGDCNDSSAISYPGAPELCDGIDNDCSQGVPFDEIDHDNDSYRVCDVPADCSPFDPTVNPGSEEICNDGKDNNCDSVIDESDCIITCVDNDGDGYGTNNDPTCPNGSEFDCDDNNTAVNPDAQEGPFGDPSCTDLLDNNCDGLTDSEQPSCVDNCVDNDGDGYGVNGDVSCPQGSAADCDDMDANVNPDAEEICDGKDTDCDGWKPPNDRNVDGDPVPLCAGDCDDNDPEVYPGLIEHPLRNNCSDGLDNDCDSLADEADTGCFPPSCETQSGPKQGPHFFTLLNPDDTVHPDNGDLACGKCHGVALDDPIRFACQRCHADPADDSDPLNGTFREQYPLARPYGFGSAPTVSLHTTWTLGDEGCVVCHNPHAQEQNNAFGTDNGKYIKEYICYDPKGIEELVEFTASAGPGSFADGPPYTENICDMCHTATNHHQRDGTAPGGQDHNNGSTCTECHPHIDGFAPTGGVAQSPHNTDFFNSNCQLCHVETGGVVNFGTVIPDDNCQRCHGERSTHTSDAAKNPLATGNYTYNLMCVDCHNPMTSVLDNRKLLRPFLDFERSDGSGNVSNTQISNTTIRGGGSLSDGAPHAENICDACHSITNHNRYDGQNGSVHNDTIDRTDSYCMVCHDHNKAFMAPGTTCDEENLSGIDCGP